MAVDHTRFGRVRVSVDSGVPWGFKSYVEKLMNYNVVYGSITGVIVLMIWLYISGLVLLIGGELNAVLESEKLNKHDSQLS